VSEIEKNRFWRPSWKFQSNRIGNKQAINKINQRNATCHNVKCAKKIYDSLQAVEPLSIIQNLNFSLYITIMSITGLSIKLKTKEKEKKVKTLKVVTTLIIMTKIERQFFFSLVTNFHDFGFWFLKFCVGPW
jgi:hypothetical protein